MEENFPRYDDQGYNFYYNQEDYPKELQAHRNTWSYTVIRPNAINGYAPNGKFTKERFSVQDIDSHIANGMSEVLTIVIYMLICKGIDEPAKFPGNEYFWNSIDDNSYAPSLADLTVFAASRDSCKNEAFNHVNGDVFVWKHIWQDFAAYFGLEVCAFPHRFEA